MADCFRSVFVQLNEIQQIRMILLQSSELQITLIEHYDVVVLYHLSYCDFTSTRFFFGILTKRLIS